jgi:hypothetical protein
MYSSCLHAMGSQLTLKLRKKQATFNGISLALDINNIQRRAVPSQPTSLDPSALVQPRHILFGVRYPLASGMIESAGVWPPQ